MHKTDTSTMDSQATSSETCYQISDDDMEDIEEFDDFDDDCLLEEAEGGVGGGRSSVIAGRGPYERAWTTNATRALIHIRGPMEGRFTEGRQKRTALWLSCTRQMQKLGYRYSAAKVQKKWHNILITYNKNLSKKFTAGYVHWEFFEEMFKYLDLVGKQAECEGQLSTATTELQELSAVQPIPPPLQPQQMLPKLQPAPPAMMTTPSIKHCQPARHESPTQLDTESKSNDEFDEEDSNSIAELKAPKLEQGCRLEVPSKYMNGDVVGTTHEASWVQDYFERKLLLEREKLQAQRDMHREQMQYSKIALLQQEKIERVKIDAINSLTGTLQKLVEGRAKKN